MSPGTRVQLDTQDEDRGRTGSVLDPADTPFVRDGYVCVRLDAEAGQVNRGGGQIARGGRGGKLVYVTADVLVLL